MSGVYTITKNIGSKTLRDSFLKGKHASYITGGNLFFIVFENTIQRTKKKKDEIFVCVYFNKVSFVLSSDLRNKGNPRDIRWLGCRSEVVREHVWDFD